jgi:GH24 family phage-related lysozyme (muramidase)
MLFTDSFKDHLKTTEGLVYHLYLDTNGYVTVGYGHMMEHVGLALKLPFQTAMARTEAARALFSQLQMPPVSPGISQYMKMGARRATQDEIKKDWNEVKAQPFGPHIPASSFQEDTECWLLKQDIEDLFDQDLQEHVSSIKQYVFPDFDTLPQAAQEAIFDMEFNMGPSTLNKFINFKKAVNARDWDGAASSCHRITPDEERNVWTKNVLLKLAMDTRANESCQLNRELKQAHRGF